MSFSTPLAPPVTLPRLGAPLPLDRFPGMRPFCSGASGVDHTADSASGSPRAGHGGAGCSPGTLLGGLGGPGLGASRPSLHLGTQSRGPWLSLGSGSHPWPREPGDIRSLRKVSTLPATAAQGPCWPAPPHLLISSLTVSWVEMGYDRVGNAQVLCLFVTVENLSPLFSR